jgi:hypothetical protein
VLHATLAHTQIPTSSPLASSAILAHPPQLAALPARSALLVNTPTPTPPICVQHVSLARSVWLVRPVALHVLLAPSLASLALEAVHLALLVIIRLAVLFSAITHARQVKSRTQLLPGASRAAMGRLHFQATQRAASAMLANTLTHLPISCVRIVLLAHTHHLVKDRATFALRAPTRQTPAPLNARTVALERIPP